MAILEMQGMEPSRNRGHGGDGGGGGSDISLLLCDSMVSFVLCL
jgi:Lanthionine-containing peptide SapB precursor RamS